ncbi:MAG: universal stress protein [Cytophagales bacterium]|nr:universal stress protein [Cytophagales bacterium]
MKILAPTDFSTNANQALDYASLVAKATGSELILLYAYSPQVTRYNLAYPLIIDEIVRAQKEAVEKLTVRCAAISRTHEITCRHVVREGLPVDEILAEAADGIDMIIMGTEGASGLGKVLFGSNTASVIEKATCPVLAVPMRSKLLLPGKVVFATDYQDNDMQTLKSLNKLTTTLGAELHIVHISKDKLKQEKELIDIFSREVAKETNIKKPMFHVMPHDDKQEGIDLFVDSVGADLIALSTRERSIFKKFFGSSLTKKMAYQARLPLLAYHAKKLDTSKDSDF